MSNAPTAVVRSRRAIALVLAAALSVAWLGACSSDDGDATDADPAEETTTSVAEGPGPDDETTTTATVPETTGGDLVGTWEAEAGELLAANTANLGGAPDIDCEGTITLEFGDDGSFSQQGEATCSTAGISASLNIETVGRYETSDGTLTITEAETLGTMEAGGMSQPAEAGFGVGEAAYEVDGDTLSVTFTDPSVGTVTQTYQRG